MNPPYCGAEACMYSEEGAGAAGCSTGTGAGTGSATTGAGTGASGSGSGTGAGAGVGSPIGTGADPPKRSDSNALPAAFRSSCCWSIRSFVACRSWMLLRASFRAPRVWRSSSIRSVMVLWVAMWQKENTLNCERKVRARHINQINTKPTLPTNQSLGPKTTTLQLTPSSPSGP